MIGSKVVIRALRKVQEQILAEPDLYNQNDFGDSSSFEYRDEIPNICETPACLAGWLSFNRLGRKEYQRRLNQGELDSCDVAETFLCDEDVAPNSLFWAASSWPDIFAWKYRRAKNDLERAQVAVERIDYFIDTGE